MKPLPRYSHSVRQSVDFVKPFIVSKHLEQDFSNLVLLLVLLGCHQALRNVLFLLGSLVVALSCYCYADDVIIIRDDTFGIF